MQKNTVSKLLVAAALIAGATYFLFYTENGRAWLQRLQNMAAEQMDQWLADLETYLKGLELEEEA